MWSRVLKVCLGVYAGACVLWGDLSAAALEPPTANVTLQWDPSVEPNVAGYVVYWGTESGNYTGSKRVGNIASTTVTNLVVGTTYFFAVTAYNRDEVESPLSAEIRYTVGTAPPPSTATDRLIVEQGGTATLLADGTSSVLANDAGGAGMTAAVQRLPTEGELVFNADGTFSYTHYGGGSLNDSFTYTAYDGQTWTEPATVYISVFKVTEMAKVQDNVVIRVNTNPGTHYTLQVASSPAPEASWADSGLAVMGDGGIAEFVDFGGAGGAPRFYRVVASRGEAPLASPPIGYYPIPVQAGPNFVAQPLHLLPTLVVRPMAISASGIALPAPLAHEIDLSPKSGFYQFIVVVREGTAQGEWWPIVSNTDSLIFLDTRGADLTQILQPGVQMEVRRMDSLSSLFGSDITAATIVLDLSTVIFRMVNSNGTGSYYILRGNSTVGPYSGSVLTLFPGQPVLFYGAPRNGAFYALGQVQMTRFSHYLASGDNCVASVFPEDQLLYDSGLLDSGWLLDADGMVVEGEDDILRVPMYDLSEDLVIYHNGTVSPAGWYINGTLNELLRLYPAQGYVISLAPRQQRFQWIQFPPWN